MSSRNIFNSSPAPKRKPGSDYVLGEVLGYGVRPQCDGAPVTRRCSTFGGCENYSQGCKYKISVLAIPSPCVTCLTDIKPGVVCLGVPNQKAEKTKAGKVAYVNTHLKWEDCLGTKLKLTSGEAFRFIEKVEEDDDRIDLPCVRCKEEIVQGDFVISTYHPNPTGTQPANDPLHAKDCASGLFKDNRDQFVNTMQLDGLAPDKVVDTKDLDFEF